MKTIFIVPTIFFLALTISCKKKRTCTCTTSTTVVDTYPNGQSTFDTYSSSSTVTAEKQTKKYFRMDNECYSYSSKSTNNDNGYNETRTEDVNCTLK